MIREQILLRAAALLREDADCLRESHTIDGTWPEEDQQTKADHDERIELADALIAMAKPI